MPTYEYACRSCGEHLEVVQSFKDDPLTTCPNCEGQLKKVFSAAGIIFKGSGWHSKDYASTSGGASGAPAASSDDSSGSSGSGDGKDTSGTSSKDAGASKDAGSSSSGSSSSAEKSA